MCSSLHQLPTYKTQPSSHIKKHNTTNPSKQSSPETKKFQTLLKTPNPLASCLLHKSPMPLTSMRTLRLTDPFGYVSSGSEHDAVINHSESSSLSDMVECFLEQDYNNSCCRNGGVVEEPESDQSSSDRVESCLNPSTCDISELLSRTDPYQQLLKLHVFQAIKILGKFISVDKSALNRNVMYWLRKSGHNAAICKSKWDRSGGSLAAGSYEFVDVIESRTKTRYFVDLKFSAEFKVARPTERYAAVLEAVVPEVVVATEEVLKKVVKAVSEEARRSIKSGELHLPPWRKNRYMQMKWFGPYRRTTNLFAESGSPLTVVNSAVKCQTFLGFEVGKKAVTEANGVFNTVRTR